MKRKPKKNKSIILRLLILGVCAYFCVTLISLWNKLNEKQQELSQYNEQKQILEIEVEEMHAMLDKDSNVQITEWAAREHLGYAYSNEQVFEDISGR
ncbi:MAG: septum formation initiator family protein [Acutalibacteraceae bacterium]|jgi:cell division protein FtsB|nr:septum formation initiator family protein [Acutalibacteraceae bacterium]